MVASAGVTLSAICNNSRVAMTILWLALYGGGALLELLPRNYATPDRILQQLPEVLRGNYDPSLLGDVVGVSLLAGGPAMGWGYAVAVLAVSASAAQASASALRAARTRRRRSGEIDE